MAGRRSSIATVVAVAVLAVPLSAFLWFASAITGSSFMASGPSPEGVVGSRFQLAAAVLLWAAPVAVAWHDLGRRTAGITGAVMGTGLILALAWITAIGAW